MVQPSNQPHVVDEFLSHLHLDATKHFFLQPNDSGSYMMQMSSVTVDVEISLSDSI